MKKELFVKLLTPGIQRPPSQAGQSIPSSVPKDLPPVTTVRSPNRPAYQLTDRSTDQNNPRGRIVAILFPIEITNQLEGKKRPID